MAPMPFVRSDGSKVEILDGFRERVLGSRSSVSPREEWSPEQYGRAAEKKVRRFARLRSEFVERISSFADPATTAAGGRTIETADVLEMGCGDGINSLLLALSGVGSVQGVDLAPALLEDSSRGERARRLADLVLARSGYHGGFRGALDDLPVRITAMDATALDLAEATFDLVWSRSVLEHVMPVQDGIAEAVRVARPGGLVHHRIDPYFGIRGCHKRGVVDIPWAHARLDLDDFRRYVASSEGDAWARRRDARLRSLNRYGTQAWRDLVSAGPVELLVWAEVRSELADAVLTELPEVTGDLLAGVTPEDLTVSELQAWLRRSAP